MSEADIGHCLSLGELDRLAQRTAAALRVRLLQYRHVRTVAAVRRNAGHRVWAAAEEAAPLVGERDHRVLFLQRPAAIVCRREGMRLYMPRYIYIYAASLNIVFCWSMLPIYLLGVFTTYFSTFYTCLHLALIIITYNNEKSGQEPEVNQIVNRSNNSGPSHTHWHRTLALKSFYTLCIFYTFNHITISVYQVKAFHSG